jgi:hypothetical protein
MLLTIASYFANFSLLILRIASVSFLLGRSVFFANFLICGYLSFSVMTYSLVYMLKYPPSIGLFLDGRDFAYSICTS